LNDLQKKGPSDELSLAEFIGLCSAACNRPVAASLAVPGIIRLSGTMDDVKDLEDILRVAKNAGAKKVLLPLSCIKDLQNVSAELLGSVSPDFYPDGDAVAAARKALGLN
jgi:ATP-dependent Lon protease